jgi:hypothetical protein
VVVDAMERECVEVAELDTSEIERFRARFNVSRDADRFEML